MPLFTYDPSTDIGNLRMRLQDTNLTIPGAASEDYDKRDVWTCLFSDEEYQAFIDRTDSLDLALAQILRTVAHSKMVLLRYAAITVGDVKNDLGRLASDLIAAAESLEKLSATEPVVVVGGPDESIFDLDERRWRESLT